MIWIWHILIKENFYLQNKIFFKIKYTWISLFTGVNCLVKVFFCGDFLVCLTDVLGFSCVKDWSNNTVRFWWRRLTRVDDDDDGWFIELDEYVTVVWGVPIRTFAVDDIIWLIFLPFDNIWDGYVSNGSVCGVNGS